MGDSYFKMLEYKQRENVKNLLKDKELDVSKKLNLINTQVFLKPSDKALSDIYSTNSCQNLSLFTFTIGKDFAQIVKDSIEKCTGTARLVFSISSTYYPKGDKAVTGIKSIKLNAQQILKSLIEIQKKRAEGTFFELYINQLSHIKLLQRDDHIIFGSCNFSMSSDSPNKDSANLTYDELICEGENGGQDLADTLFSYLELKYPNIRPIRIDHNTLISDILDDVVNQASVKSNFNIVNQNKVTEKCIVREDVFNLLKKIISVSEADFDRCSDLQHYEAEIGLELDNITVELQNSTIIEFDLYFIDDVYEYVEESLKSFKENNFEAEDKAQDEFSCYESTFYNEQEESGEFLNSLRSKYKEKLECLRNKFIEDFQSGLDELFDKYEHVEVK